MGLEGLGLMGDGVESAQLVHTNSQGSRSNFQKFSKLVVKTAIINN